MWKLIDKIKAKFSRKFKKEVDREHFLLNLDFGLSSEQVQQRNEDGLINKTKKFVTKSYFRIIYENVFNFFNILLFLITAAMIVARIEVKNFVFVGILVLNISIGLYQDVRARVLIDKLKVISSVTVNVLRDGQIKSVKANEVVLSDIIEIKQGSQLVCDGTIVKGFAELNESLLTGESVNIAKEVGSKVYSGSFTAAGTALYRVDHIGRENYAEQLQQNASKFKRVKSEILSSLKTIFKVVGFIVVALATAQIIIYRKDFVDVKSDAFTKTVGSIATSLVGMIPIGMYLLTSVTLAVGVIRLIKRNMLTQDMYCIETLARVDTLCLDKTGTITDGNLNVLKVVSTSETSEKDLAKIIKSLVVATKDDNATARAIRKEFYKLNSFDSYSAIPFNSERKYSAVMLEDGRSIVMGAREFIPHNDPKVDEECRVYERQGMRVLVLALHKHVITIDEKLEESQIIGYLVLQDHIRDDAPDNIRWFKENGVDIRIITGDNPESAAEIARRAGVEGADKYISLEGMSLEEVRHFTRDYVIFGRVTPEQKEVIIEALKDDGHTVAMTGDGVNDILALRVADCSIAMASGSDAAKNVSHLVSLDSSFSALPDVVREGRRVINNLQRTVSLFLVKTIFASVLTVLFITGMFKLSNKYPFILTNMFLWEILTIGVGALFVSLQPNDEQIKSKFLLNIVFRLIPASAIQIGLVIFFFLYCNDYNTAMSLSVLAFSLFSFVIFIRVCMPFDVYRALLVIGLTFVGVVAVIADKFAGMQLFGIRYETLSPHNFLVLGIVLGVALVIYLALSFGVSKLHKYMDKKREERRYDHF